MYQCAHCHFQTKLSPFFTTVRQLNGFREVQSRLFFANFTQINNGIQNVIPNAKRVQCGWHIITKGFERNVDTTFPDIAATVVEKYKKRILNWMHSTFLNNVAIFVRRYVLIHEKYFLYCY